MDKFVRITCSVTLLTALAGLSSSCGSSTDITWRSDVASPDGKWTATAMTEGVSGPGNAYLGTTVFLKRTDTKGRGLEVLGYQEDGSTWARGRAPLILSWTDRQTLKITFKRLPKLDLQVCKWGDIDISVSNSP